MRASQSEQVRRWRESAARANYSSRELARLCKVSVRQLERQFLKCLGCSPQTWLSQVRILAAEERLISGDQVKVVASELGYKSASNFCHLFRTSTHQTATQFVARQTDAETDVASVQQMSLPFNLG